MKWKHGARIGALTFCLLFCWPYHAGGQPADKPVQVEERKGDHEKPVRLSRLHKPVIWHDPGAIAPLDLFYGQGGKDAQPVAPFKFESENLHGSNPKLDVNDAQGTKWRVKLGDEARPEVVASRLLWAVGYFVEDDYVLPVAEIENLRITRGANLAKGGQVKDARFARKKGGQKKIGIWRWKHNPFKETREFNGLRVMMALMNNWDLKDVNNAVLEDTKSGEDIFLTSDIGATFGTNGLSWSNSRSKGDVETFARSRFIKNLHAGKVDFATPAAPTPLLAPDVWHYEKRRGFEWIGKDIPIADARWIGSLLKQLSHQQLVDAFRAGHFPPAEVDEYVSVVESRIHELAGL
jgi:hypothetical protein